MKSVIKRVLDGDWASLQSDIEQMAANKVKTKVDEKKFDVLAKLNNVNIEKQKEAMAVSEATKEETAKKKQAEAKLAKAKAELTKAKADKKAGKKVTKADIATVDAKLEKAKKAVKAAKNAEKKDK